MQKNDIFKVLSYAGTFVVGGAIGAVVSGYFTKKKMDELNTKDLADLKAYYEDKKVQSYFPNPASSGEEVEIPDHVNVVTLPETEEDGEAAIFVPGAAPTVDSIKQGGELDTHKMPYSRYFPAPDETMTDEADFFDADAKPYHIDVDDFGTKDLYSEITVMLYIDVDKTTNPNDPVYILCDEDDQPIENVEQTVGDYTKYVTAYADPIYMRNDRLRIDYEILPTNIPYSAEDGVDRSMPDDEEYGD